MSTTDILVARSRKFAAGAGALTAAVALGATLLGAAPAQAVTPERPYGTVMTKAGVAERQYPSTDSAVKGSLSHRHAFGLRCKVRAESVGGNNIWYMLRERDTWVSAKYVNNTSAVPFCKDASHGRAEPKATVKHAAEPKTAAKHAAEPKTAAKHAVEPKTTAKHAVEPKTGSKQAVEPKTVTKHPATPVTD
ncbi:MULTISPECIES: SH3 domain-containing protein [Streptomyces]|uniref:SH3 domain-containing protein n=1 Tax=Streptomyces TaxID=1883 RepID=UPI000A564D46|nr:MULTISPECIES: SH3 domain-containing protein [Streptomyces]